MNKMFKTMLMGTAALGVMGSSAAWAETTEVDVTLLLVADIYEMGADWDRGGFSRAAAVARDEKAGGGHVLYVHAGDTISPSLFSGFDQGEHVINLLNMEAPDIFVPGNHEYDFGEEIFKTRMNDLNSTKLAANLRNADGSEVEGFSDTVMLDYDGLMIGVVGLTAEDSITKSSPGTLQFTPALDTLATQAGALREQGADLVVAVTHSSLDVDRILLNSGLADIILSGDDHTLHIYDTGSSILAEPESDAMNLIALDISATIEVEEDDRDVDYHVNYRVIDTAAYEVPSDYAETVAALQAELDRELDVTLGTVDTPLDSRRASVRTQETAIGNLIADAMREAVGADIAITNGGGIRADREYEAGYEITRKDILSELPFGNLNISLEVSGQDIWDALENGLQSAPEATGRFPQISGMTVVYDPSKEAGSRVVSVMVGDAALDPAATYTVATNDYMGRGGDGYSMFSGKPMVFSMTDAKLMANDVMAYIRANGNVAPAVEGRITTGM